MNLKDLYMKLYQLYYILEDQNDDFGIQPYVDELGCIVAELSEQVKIEDYEVMLLNGGIKK